MSEWEYGWKSTTGELCGWGLTREEAEEAVAKWNERARELRRAAGGNASYPGARVIRRVAAVAAGEWEPVPARDTP